METLPVLIDLDDWLLNIEIDYNLPLLQLDEFIVLGQRIINIYNLSAKNTPFETVCEHMYKFTQTDIGNRILSKL